MRALVIAATTAAVALPVPAGAQDWDVHRDERTKTVMAYAVFDAGVGITFRCQDGGYDAVIGGLPPAGDESTRPLRLVFGEPSAAPHFQNWNVAVDDTMAVSPLPAPLARRLREGGRLQIVVPAATEGGRNLRYDLMLPASAAAIDDTLTACGRPLVDPRDAMLTDLDDVGLPSGMMWTRRPRPDYPNGRKVYVRGFAVATCVTAPDGRLRDCVIETEHPRDGGFGEEVLRGARGARVGHADGSEAPFPVRRVMFRVDFRMQ
ncbi:MAG TPA: hypothetical protein VGR32_03990 [Brevundimonas sp.]|jgi:hypothetical protein|uniref:hypothetical protein n=1 Tax=Brevundimonas sp. TaxID=1871086 RepID=UPI002DF3C957|nr:hypothetical protein [Brevundimonas sp.]